MLPKKSNADLLTQKWTRRKQTELEVQWNDDARRDYLLGFHNRKQMRLKSAEEAAKQRCKDFKREERRMKRQIMQDQVKALPEYAEWMQTEEKQDIELEPERSYQTWTTVTTVSTFDPLAPFQSTANDDPDALTDIEEEKKAAPEKKEKLQQEKKTMSMKPGKVWKKKSSHGSSRNKKFTHDKNRNKKSPYSSSKKGATKRNNAAK